LEGELCKGLNIYDRAEIIEFCSAKISHNLAQTNHQNILVCPFKIAVYTLSESPDKVHVIYALPEPLDDKSKSALDDANTLIQEIIEEALEW